MTTLHLKAFAVLSRAQASVLRSFVSGLDAVFCKGDARNGEIVRLVIAYMPELTKIAAALEMQSRAD